MGYVFEKTAQVEDAVRVRYDGLRVYADKHIVPEGADASLLVSYPQAAVSPVTVTATIDSQHKQIRLHPSKIRLDKRQSSARFSLSVLDNTHKQDTSIPFTVILNTRPALSLIHI